MFKFEAVLILLASLGVSWRVLEYPEKSRVTQNRSYMFATVGLISLINEFSCLVATSDFDRLQCLIESMLSQGLLEVLG